MLGASRRQAFRHVTLPLLAPSILAAASIVFLFTFTSFGVVLLLGGPAHATIEVEIYRQAIELFDLPTAAALAVVQIVAVLAVLLVHGRAQERRAVTQRLVAAADTARRPHGRASGSSSAAVLGATTLFLGVPLVVLACAVVPRRRPVEPARRTARSGRARRRARCSSRRGRRCATRSCSR